MIANRSVPTDTVLPHVNYQNLPAALKWLAAAFGFQEHYHYGEPISGAQVLLGKACIMLNATRGGEAASPSQIGRHTQSLTVFVEDVEGHFERAKTAGAHIVEELHETCYGELQYGVLDLEGHHWLFSRHARDLSPVDWGATMVL
ncbi:MAG TPA: VOC family protein [Bryobacteraceae bacterium]|nr:VOC family protein [Bryobacteraceae bacterium]